MMEFRYRATDCHGKRQQGQLSADSAREARQRLREQQLLPQSLEPVTARATREHALKHRDFVLMMRQLATLTSASLPLAQSLQALENQCDKPRQKALLHTLRQQVLEGSSLAEAVARWPKTFTPLYRAMIAAGEASGRLDRVLEQLADYSEKAQQLKSKLLQAMIYPLLLTVVALIVVGILLTAVVPEVVSQFTHMRQQLPATTRLLMQLSAAAQQYGALLIVLVAASLTLFRLALRRPDLRLRWHQRQLRLPVFGRIVLNLNLARYARTLSILTHSAVPLLESMAISAAVLSNDFIRQQLQQAADRVREGATLTQALDETRLLTPMMRHMIASGEQSGELDAMLKRTADIQDQAFMSQMTLAVSLFEPLLIVVMAAVVLFIILAILQPILQLNSLTG
ncbi:type II secretion system protein GspF [Enterobacterales bacterium CwR94]|nr:type II secretion system protein GspF [Enterobacterales bacterium CwR94]